MTADIRLHEYSRFLRIHAYGKVKRRHIQYMLPQLFRVLRHSYGVEIHYTVYAFIFFLKLNELLQCSEIISQMYISCRLNA